MPFFDLDVVSRGGLEGHPMFCVVLWAAIGARTQAVQRRNKIWLYVDDAVTHAPSLELPVDAGVTHDLGGHLNTPTSAFHAPCLVGTPWTQWPDELKATTARGSVAPGPMELPEHAGDAAQEHTPPIQEDGLTILGSAAN